MTEPLFSGNWYRVAALRPRLRAHAQIHRQNYRGQTWYVLQDPTSQRFHRFSPSAYAILGLMDGRRTMQEIWDRSLDELGDDAVTQDQLIQLLGQLHSADVLQCNLPPDTAELFRRRSKQKKQALKRRLFALFAWQIPLFDPERFVTRCLPWARPWFSIWGFLVWCGVVGVGLVLAATHWDELTRNMLDRVLLPSNLILIWFLFPLVKLLHEFGHAFAVKAYGGEVHEMGVMILVLTPVPYVDASAAWAFRSKWQRFTVGAAGMMVEVFVAALCMLFWVNAEPGTLRAIAYNVMLIAGVSTVLFNINPLLRFDGYYMLSDLLEIPNLRQRANQYLAYVCERYLFGRREAEAPESTPGERAWFVGFSLAAFAYRVLVVAAIFLFLGDYSLVLAAVFGAFTIITWFGVPAAKGIGYLFNSPRLRRVRGRALAVTGGFFGALAVLILLVPMPFRTVAEGVVWVPEEGLVRAGTDGFIAEVVAEPGSHVRRGDLLVRLADPQLDLDARVLEAKQREVAARYREHLGGSRVQLEILREEQHYTGEKLARARQKLDELAIRSRTDGLFVLPRSKDLPGRFVKQGQVLAHVLSEDAVTVRTVVPQEDIQLVRDRTRGVDVRLAERLDSPVRGEVQRLVPAASQQLPSPALGTHGGGAMAVDPTDPEGRKAVRRFFQVDLELPVAERANIGGHAYIRFDHGYEPLGVQWYRRLRQLFLSRFNV